MFYPEPQQPLPCYAAEFVVLSGKPIVAVLDAKCLLDSDLKPHVEATMMTARQGIKYRPEENPLPEWFEHWKSGFEILVRPKTVEKMSGLLAIHLHIWESITWLFTSDVDCFNHEFARLHNEMIVNYKRQHAINYPGFPLLNRSFSNIWTTTYLGEYLFG